MTAAQSKIYVVDDDQHIHEYLRNVFKNAAIQSEHFSEPKSFLLRLKEALPAACMIDLRFEGVSSGFQLIQAVRNFAGLALPIIVISSANDSESVAHAFELGATDYIFKPFDSATLFRKLNALTGISLQKRFSLPDRNVSAGAGLGQLISEMQICEVDELGILFSSKHLLTKGSQFKVSGQPIEEISDSADPMILTVMTTRADAKSGRYLMYCLFDVHNELLLRSVRHWLVQMRQD